MALGMETLHLGITANMEKIKLGAVARQSCVYLQASEHYSGVVLREIAAEASLVRA